MSEVVSVLYTSLTPRLQTHTHLDQKIMKTIHTKTNEITQDVFTRVLVIRNWYKTLENYNQSST